MRSVLKSLLVCSFFLAISTYGISQVSTNQQMNERAVDSVLRQQQILRRIVRLNPQNIKPLFGFSTADATAGLSRKFSSEFQTGITTGCSDTSSRFFLKGNSSSFYVGDYIRSRDGNLLVAGQYVTSNAGSFISKGFLMKCDENGNVFWAHLYENLNSANTNDFIYYYKLIELGNGNILLAGSTLDFVTQNNDLIITTTDNSGNLIWSKNYKSRLWSHGNQSSNYYYVQQMVQDQSSGNVFITGQHWTEGRSIIKLDAVNGNILWSKLYQPSDDGYFDDPFGVDIRNNELRIFGHFLTSDGARISVYTLNKSTGDTIKSRFYKIAGDGDSKNTLVGINPLVKLDNGNFALTGEQYGYNRTPGDTGAYYHAGYIQLDKNLNFISAYSFRNKTRGSSSNTMLTVLPDGSGLFTMLQYVSAFSGPVYYVQFKDGKILNQRIRYYSGQSVPNEHPALQLNDGGVLVIKLLGDSVANDTKVEFLKLHASDSSSQCLGVTDHSTFIEPFYLEDTPGFIDSVGNNVFQENINKSISVSNTNLTYYPGCQQISFCDSLSVSSSSNSICGGDSLLVNVHTNPECTGSVFFSMDSSRLQSITGINDSAYLFRFTSSWQGTIYAGLHGCKSLTDSLVIISPSISLAKDTGFCPGKSLELDAGPGFSNYQWNTGSDQQKIIVTNPGHYSIEATTAVGCKTTDTISVQEFATPVAGISKDSTLCEGNVRILDAGNFNSYKWNTGETTRTIDVNHLGIYSVKVTDNHGCSGSDTAQIKKVVPIPNRFLPTDTSICSYRPLVLTSLNDYSNYLWNTNAITKAITVSQPGLYWLLVTDAQNCTGRDSIILHAENCVQGFYIPNAFTPNNDGKNDVFKPFLFAPADEYEFTIYNRAGEIIFKTHQLSEAWNGNYKGMPQDAGVFVWICKYRFTGQQEKIERGSVTLLR
ncbi:MAG: gliding motility-associated C-terminal domain-containing protein [Bacteroidota bacterium]|nr:gliding motility-associated C-terminal domain-containing protein [Bacteroidota bacterium]